MEERTCLGRKQDLYGTNRCTGLSRIFQTAGHLLSGMEKAVVQPPILSLPKNMATRSVYTTTSKRGLPYIAENTRKRGIASLFFL